MIQRRQFLGSVAAFCATSASLSRLASAVHPTDGLNWRCEVIESIAHNHASRNPVITDVSLQSGGNLMAVVGDDHHVCIYNTAQKRYTDHLDQHSDWIRSSRFSPNGMQLATAGNDRTLLIWSTNDWRTPTITKRHPEAIIHIAYSNSGGKIATVGFETALRVYDANSGEQLQSLDCACPDNHAVAFSHDDRLISAGGRCGNIRVWNAQSGREIARFKAHRKRIRTIEFTADEKILSAGDDQFVKITDPANPRDVRIFPRHASKLYATALLNDGLVATGGSDNHIHVWQLSDLQEVGTLKGHTGTVSCLDFSGSKLVSGSYDTHVRLWSTDQYTSVPGQRHTQVRDGWNPSLK